MTDLRSAFDGQSVLVTGHTGFKGSWLTLWLAMYGARVTGVALPPDGSRSLATALDVRGLVERHVERDIRDAEGLRSIFESVEPAFVFHLAAQSLVLPSYDSPKETFDVNVGGTVNVLECVRTSPGVRSLVVVTSDKCYENREWIWGYRESDPMGGADPYSASKGAAEIVFGAYLKSFFGIRTGLGAASARAGNVIGGGDWAEHRIVPDCIRALESGLPIGVRHPESVRPWQHVLEPLSGYLELAVRLREEPNAYSGSWNFGPPESNAVPVAALVDRIVDEWGSGSWRDERDPAVPVHYEARSLTLSIEKAARVLGWRPRWDIERTVRNTVAWYRRADADVESVRSLSREQIAEYTAAA